MFVVGEMVMRVLIAASGGGHTGYALDAAIALRRHGAEVVFAVAEGDVWSRRLVEQYGEVVAETPRFLSAEEPLWRGLARAPGAVMRALRRLRRVDFDYVISTGSNHSVAVALAGRLLGARVVNLEVAVRFTRPSRAYRVLRHIAWLNVVQWPEQRRFGGDPVVVGPFYKLPRTKVVNRGYVLVATGSHGYPELVKAFADSGLPVVLQVGKNGPDPSYLATRGRVLKAFRFDPDFDTWLAGATIVVTHVSKTVVDAALGYGKPVVVVPNPRWKHGATAKDGEILTAKVCGAFAANPAEAIDMVKELKEKLSHVICIKRVREKHGWGPEKLAQVLKMAERGSK